jgi:hypothetical protein
MVQPANQLRQRFRNCIKALSVVCILVSLAVFHLTPVHARSISTPWTNEYGPANLIYGASTPWDVQNSVGRPPDDIKKTEQMYPVVENHYYFDEKGSGAATVFVFEASLLVGMHYRSPDDQWVDLTYFLTDTGDRALNNQMLGGYRSYFPWFPLYGMY